MKKGYEIVIKFIGPHIEGDPFKDYQEKTSLFENYPNEEEIKKFALFVDGKIYIYKRR